MLKYPKLGYEITENAMVVLKERYLFRNPEGKVVETPAQMFLRVAKFVAGVEKTKALKERWTNVFYDMMASGEFLPNTPTLLNSGRKNISVLAGCFVIDVKDSVYGGLDSIFGAIQLMALIHKMGGGTGCFRSNTKIALLDGREICILELVKEFAEGKKNWVYSCDSQGKIISGEIVNAQKTIEQAPMLEIVLDNKKIIHCTYDHLFLLRSGKYKQAQFLKQGDSLMPLYRKLSTEKDSSQIGAGYEMVFDNLSKSWEFTHHKTAELVIKGKGKSIRHHIDMNKRNNNPSNIKWVEYTEHWKIHADWITSFNKTEKMRAVIRARNANPEFQKKVQKTRNESIKNSPAMRKRISKGLLKYSKSKRGRKQSSDWITFLNANPSKGMVRNRKNFRRTFVIKIAREILSHKLSIRKWNASVKVLKTLGVLTRGFAYKKEVLKYFSNLLDLEKIAKNQLSEVEKVANHKVISIRALLGLHDGYDLTIKGVPNFALSAGVLVHNCSFHKLRPEGSKVSSTGHIASGPVSFMRNFNEAIEAIQQGGMRRGAHMSLMKVDHPDIEQFILCKNTLNQRTTAVMDRITKALRLDVDGEFYTVIKEAIIRSQLTNMNISIALTSEFKEALRRGTNYNIRDPRNGEIVKQENAERIFHLMAENAWKSGEPGFVDLERINKDNTCPHLGEIYSTNPCGEQPLRPFESCTLGSIALSRMVNKKGIAYKFDYHKFAERISHAIHFLDNVLDAQDYPVSKIEKESKRTRKIGLGVMGFADLLLKLKIRYGSNDCIKLIGNIMTFFSTEAHHVSEYLGREKGCFPAWKNSDYGRSKLKMRNASRTTIAPTGSISGIAGVSFGIEPLYGLSYTRRILGGKTFLEVNQVAREILVGEGYWSKEVEEYIIANGTLSGCLDVPERIIRYLPIAHEISPEKHIKVQAAFQEFIDNAVSKTINLPNSSTVEDVKQIFYKALELRCKGITVYRDGSREGQVLTTGKAKFQSIRQIRKRPRSLKGITYEKQVGDCGKLFVIVNTDEHGYPFEIFIEAGKAGGCMQSQAQAIGRLISAAWRGGLGLEVIIKQLTGITCHQSKPSIDKQESFLSCADAIAKIIQEHFSTHKDLELKEFEEDKPVSRVCSYCGGPVQHEGHCATCTACFQSLCG